MRPAKLDLERSGFARLPEEEEVEAEVVVEGVEGIMQATEAGRAGSECLGLSEACLAPDEEEEDEETQVEEEEEGNMLEARRFEVEDLPML